APYEQDRAEQGCRPERQHDRGGIGDFLARLTGRGVGSRLHARDELLHADGKTDVQLAGFIQHGLAVVVGVQFLWRTLNAPALPSPSASSFAAASRSALAP